MLSAQREFSFLMARVRYRLALAALAKMLSPPASCLVFNPDARQGGTFSQLVNECLLRHLEVEIACKCKWSVLQTRGQSLCPVESIGLKVTHGGWALNCNGAFLPLPVKWLLQLLRASRASSQLSGQPTVLQGEAVKGAVQGEPQDPPCGSQASVRLSVGTERPDPKYCWCTKSNYFFIDTKYTKHIAETGSVSLAKRSFKW